VVAKQDSTKTDGFTKLCVLRLIKHDETGETLKIKKWIFLAEVLSYEEGHSADFDWEGDTMFVVCTNECFYCAGSVVDFNKKMDEFIENLNLSEGT
jgi:hypothetical protein